ncbi:adenosine deaminase [Colletes latitarsis]|uniref:adenosine deaminase n=1 Tax=Colletes latitarsis TaxID=2605962 RepID=UPI00403552E1
MKEVIFTFLVILGQVTVNVAMPRINYSTLRRQILEYEQRMSIGANLSLNNVEVEANKILMNAKRKELDAAFKNPSQFTPGRNFMSAKNDIDRSKVFQFLRRMPKGAVLHAHDTAMVSFDYMYHNVTFFDNLYICDKKDNIRLHFFREPDKDCDWELLKTVREDPSRASHVNKKIKEKLTMICKTCNDTYSDTDKAWSKFNSIFEFVQPLVTYRPVWEDHFLKALEELYQDNVMYLELRTTLPKLYDFNDTVYKPRDLVGVYENLTERFKKDHPDFVGVKLIYAPQRSVDNQRMKDYVKTLKELQQSYPKFIAGFDLVGQEDKGKTLKYFADILMEVESNTKFFFHAGETNWYGSSTDENLVDAILLNTRRIGHGYALIYHPFLMEMVKRMDIAIEVNPISNQVLKLVDDLRNHAARRLFAEGYPVVVSNDDPGFWNARALSYDFYETFMALMSDHSDLKGLKQLAMNSLIYSSMNNTEKNMAMTLWEKKWDIFVENVARNGH